MELPAAFRKCVASLIAVSAGFAVCVALCTSTVVQRQIFYLHKAPIWWRQKLDKPETFGFLHNQVLPLRIPTSDGKKLYAWLVTPLALYARNEKELAQSSQGDQQHWDTALRLLNDPESRLVIYFHGNAGTVGQTRRTDAYRMITSGASERVHVLAFDYRGFGLSSGHPTEAGLIEDALSVIKWATTVGKVPTNRIVLLAQSLGTAVATAAAEAIVQENPGTEFAGVILCAAFPDAPSVIMSYKVGGYFPLLAPLKAVAPVKRWFASKICDKWNTQQRLGSLVNASNRLRLTFFAAESDEVIPYENTENLFYATVCDISGTKNTRSRIDKSCQQLDLGEGGSVQEWIQDGKHVRKVVVRYGGMYTRTITHYFLYLGDFCNFSLEKQATMGS